MSADDLFGGGGGTEPDPNAPAGQTMQPAPPGHLDALAQQLNAGYGGGQQAHLDHLNSMYGPVQMLSQQDIQDILGNSSSGLDGLFSGHNLGPSFDPVAEGLAKHFGGNPVIQGLADFTDKMRNF